MEALYMKKFVALLLAGMLLLSAVPAMADPVSVQTIRARDVDVLGSLNVLKIWGEDSSYYRLTDLDGNVLVPETAQYSEIRNRYYSFLEVQGPSADGIHYKGVIDIAGNVVVPVQYADLDYISSRWIAGIRLTPSTAEEKDYTYTSWSSDEKSFYRIDTVDFYYNGTLAGTLNRADYKGSYCTAHGAYVRVTNMAGEKIWYNSRMERSAYTGTSSGEFDSEYRNGKYFYYHTGTGQQAFVDTCTLDVNDLDDPYLYDGTALYDIRGNEVFKTAQKYDKVNAFSNGYAIVRGSGYKTYGLIDSQGREVIPPIYENLSNHSDEALLKYGYISAEKEGKFGFLDASGNVTCDFVYPANIVTNRTTFATLKNLDGTIIVLSAAVGELPEHYAEVNFPTYSGGCRAFEAKNSAGQRAVIDLYGHELIPFSDDYNSFDISYDGTIVVGSRGNRTYDVYRFAIEAPAAPAEPAAEQPQQPAGDGVWTCGSGHGGNTGNFCTVCGEPKPAAEEPAAEDDGTWTCANGHGGNTGNFCSECGSPKPAEEPEPLTHCPSCNYEFGSTVPKFCPNCGTPANP